MTFSMAKACVSLPGKTVFLPASVPNFASTEDVRDVNRCAVLNLIRLKQPISRADLARISGLQRSTISLIVENLIEVNWVIEGPTEPLPRGRRPTLLRLNNDRVIIGVDIRPLQITVALVDVNGNFTSQETIPTNADPKVAVASVIERIQGLLGTCRGKIVEGIGVCLPGRVGLDSGRLPFAPNLGRIKFDICTSIHKATGFDVEMENAANACALAAVWFDHIDSDNMVIVTVSEGISAGIFANGSLVRGFNGMAGEFGHVPIDLQGPVCTCGSRGCWEVFASNRAALRYYFESSAQSGMKFEELLSLADQGDERAAKSLDTMAHFLGRGMRIIVAGLDPEKILVNGDLTRSWQRFEPAIQAGIGAVGLSGVSPKLVPMHEDGRARLRGTVALILQKRFGISPATVA